MAVSSGGYDGRRMRESTTGTPPHADPRRTVFFSASTNPSIKTPTTQPPQQTLYTSTATTEPPHNTATTPRQVHRLLLCRAPRVPGLRGSTRRGLRRREAPKENHRGEYPKRIHETNTRHTYPSLLRALHLPARCISERLPHEQRRDGLGRNNRPNVGGLAQPPIPTNGAQSPTSLRNRSERTDTDCRLFCILSVFRSGLRRRRPRRAALGPTALIDPHPTAIRRSPPYGHSTISSPCPLRHHDDAPAPNAPLQNTEYSLYSERKTPDAPRPWRFGALALAARRVAHAPPTLRRRAC